jgi:hypothetical protein
MYNKKPQESINGIMHSQKYCRNKKMTSFYSTKSQLIVKIDKARLYQKLGRPKNLNRWRKIYLNKLKMKFKSRIPVD